MFWISISYVYVLLSVESIFHSVSLPHLLGDILLATHPLLEVSLIPVLVLVVLWKGEGGVSGRFQPQALQIQALIKKLISALSQVEVWDQHLMMYLIWVPVSLGRSCSAFAPWGKITEKVTLCLLFVMVMAEAVDMGASGDIFYFLIYRVNKPVLRKIEL